MHPCFSIILQRYFVASFLLGYAAPDPWDWQNAPSKYSTSIGVSEKSRANTMALLPRFAESGYNMTVHEGQTAVLVCNVVNLGKYTVSISVFPSCSHSPFQMIS